MSGSPVKKGQKRQYPGHNFSEDDPLGLNLNADEILYGDNDNEGKTEKEPIPKNVNDPLGLDSKPDSKCKWSTDRYSFRSLLAGPGPFLRIFPQFETVYFSKQKTEKFRCITW